MADLSLLNSTTVREAVVLAAFLYLWNQLGRRAKRPSAVSTVRPACQSNCGAPQQTAEVAVQSLAQTEKQLQDGKHPTHKMQTGVLAIQPQRKANRLSAVSTVQPACQSNCMCQRATGISNNGPLKDSTTGQMIRQQRHNPCAPFHAVQLHVGRVAIPNAADSNVHSRYNTQAKAASNHHTQLHPKPQCCFNSQQKQNC
jgi:hypothetical protein